MPNRRLVFSFPSHDIQEQNGTEGLTIIRIRYCSFASTYDEDERVEKAWRATMTSNEKFELEVRTSRRTPYLVLRSCDYIYIT